MNGLRRAPRLVAVEQRQHLRAAVAAADADDAGDRRIAPRRVNGRRPHLRRAGDVALRARTPIRRRPARIRAAESRRCRVELLAGERAGGRDDGEAIAWRERARLAASQEPRHLVGDRAMLVAAEHLRAARGPRAARGATAAARNRSFARRWRFSASSTRVSGSRSSSTAWIERLERRGLRVVVAAADQHAVAAGLDRHAPPRPARCSSLAIAFISRSSLRITPS